MNKFWMVWKSNGSSPTKQHASFEEAEKEASRLAKSQHGHTFFVLEAITALQPVNQFTRVVLNYAPPPIAGIDGLASVPEEKTLTA